MADELIYKHVFTKAIEIEAELKHLNRWGKEPLPPERFENMGAFGSNTMAFEQWIQFVLLPRIREIVETHGEFPDESSLAPYAIRYFDGDTEADHLHELLYQLDKLINEPELFIENKPEEEDPRDSATPPTLTYGSATIPSVIYSLIGVLPQFTGSDLESQLQTYDAFLYQLSHTVRPQIAALLQGAAAKTTNEESRLRILQAATSVAAGGRAAEPYNHEEAMKKYREEHKKSYPSE